VVALAIGFLVEALLHGQPVGVGYALAALVVVVGWLILGRGLSVQPSRSALGLLVVLFFVSAMAAVRASTMLRAMDVLLGLGLLLLLTVVYVPGGLPRLSLADYAAALFFGGIAAVVQPFVHLLGDLPKARRTPGMGRRLMPVVWGILLALPLLLVFGALFTSADDVFADYVRRLFNWDLNWADLAQRIIWSLVLSWLALGVARHAFTTGAEGLKAVRVARPDWLHLGHVEVITVLALLNALFVSFVIVQAVYLFGGVDTLDRAGLSYSTYARHGFFELVTVAALVLSVVLLLDWLVRSGGGRARLVVNLLHGLLVLLTLVILISALQRMHLYQAEYGLTELRFYTTAFMGWLAVVLIWLVVTVLRPVPGGEGLGRRRFAFGALVAGLVLVVSLNLVNPDAVIARTNLNRAVAGVGQPLDTGYLAHVLSPDAVPILLAGLDDLEGSSAQARLACELRSRARFWGREASHHDWRGVTWGEIRARRALASQAEVLKRYAKRCR